MNRPRPRSRSGRWAVVLTAGLLLSGCQTKATVRLQVQPDGSGQVTVSALLDSDAARQLGEAGVDSAGLAKAGWVVEKPLATRGGGRLFAASKAFSDPAGAQAALRDVGGGLSGFTVARQRGFWRTDIEVKGTVDLTDFEAAVSDTDLTGLLGSPLGLDRAELERQTGVPAVEAFALQLAVDLPSSQKGDAEVSLVPGDRVLVVTSSTAWNADVLAPLGVSLLALVLAVVVTIRGVRRRRRLQAIARL